MKTLGMMAILVLVLCATALADDCPAGYADCVDLGNADSMAAHNAQRWGEDPWPPDYDYGGRDGGNTIALVWEVGCPTWPDNNDDANAWLDTGNLVWDTIVIRYLDSQFNTDSFEVNVDGMPLFHVNDSNDGIDTWETVEIDVSGLGLYGQHIVKLASIEEAGPLCKDYGQNAMNWIAVAAENPIPEFSAVAMGIAVLGAGAGFLLLRKRR